MQAADVRRHGEDGDHPLDIFAFIDACAERGERCALATIVEIVGRTSRNLGAQMAVSESGRSIGYVSSGCVDADLITHAQASIAEGAPRRVRYGEGSPYIDVKLPCGGGLEILIAPDPDPGAVRAVMRRLSERRPAALSIDETGAVSALHEAPRESGWRSGAFAIAYEPRLSLIAAGRGRELVSLAAIARSAGFEVSCYSPDADSLQLCAELGCRTCHLTSPDNVPPFHDDPWTAVVLLFHDHEWEPALLERALAGEALYIGALGSRKTHEVRLDALRARGAAETDLARIKGPIGLVPAMRNAPMLAISTLAEIVEQFGRRG